MSGSSPASAPAIRNATPSLLSLHCRHDCRTVARVARQPKNGVCSNGGGQQKQTPRGNPAPRTGETLGGGDKRDGGGNPAGTGRAQPAELRRAGVPIGA